jgi:hypothetical protein
LVRIPEFALPVRVPVPVPVPEKASNVEAGGTDVKAWSSTTNGSAALLDVCMRLELIDQARHQAGKDTVVRIVSMHAQSWTTFQPFGYGYGYGDGYGKGEFRDRP